MRTFYLGVGAQKAGTTWLLRQLSHSDDFVAGLMKEYHLFDVQYLESSGFKRNNITRRLRNFSRTHDEETVLSSIEKVTSFYDDENNYFDYFDSILTSDTDFTADITPGYSGLPSEAFAKIKAKFNQRDISVKVIFLMREPVSRLDSSIKMRLRRSNELSKISPMGMIEKIQSELNSDSDLMRSNYSSTCQQLEQVFSEDDIFYGFYETLFSKPEVERLSDFFGIGIENFDVKKVVNSSARTLKYPLNELDKLKKNVQDRYQFVSERFGLDLSIWDKAVRKMVDQNEMGFLERIRFNRGWR